MNKGLLKDKVAIISGGARGVGKAIATSLAEQGCNIIIIDPGFTIGGEKNNEDNLVKDIAKMLSKKYKVKTLGYSSDISDYETVKKICNEVKNDMGKLDIVINNAAIILDSFIFKLDKISWNKVINTNLTGAFNLTSCSSRIIREQAKNNPKYCSGRIINVVSTSGIWGNYGQAAYASSKAGLMALTRVTALDLQRVGITCNAIAPFAATRVTESINPQNEEQENYKSSALKIKAHYVGQLACVLASNHGASFSGQIFGVRGKEIFIFDNANPVYNYVRNSDNITDLAIEVENNFRNHSNPLKSDLEVFSSDPIL